MDDSTDVTTFDDGLYHPPTKSSTKPSPSTIADPDAATIVSAVSATPDAPASTPTSTGTRPARKPKHVAQTDIPQESFSAPSIAASPSETVSTSAAISSSSPIPTPETLAIGSIKAEAPPPRHNSPRAVGIALASVSAVLVVVFVVGYLSSQRFRRWRQSRRARLTETKWKISRPLREGHSPGSSMREVPHIKVFSANGLVYGPVDPFARSMPRQMRMPFNLAGSDPVEEIDEERGWLWGTHASNKKAGTGRLVTPGLGIGRYRSKRGRGQRQDSLGSRPAHGELDEIDDIKEELLYTDEAGSVSEYDNDNAEQSSQRLPSTGVSCLLGRLKESITSRSAFSSLGVSTGRLRGDSSRSQWDEVGQLVYDEEKDITAQDDNDNDDDKTVGFPAELESASYSLRSGPVLSGIVLPELPVFTWDDHSGLKVAKTKRTRAPSLEVEINGARAEYVPASQPYDSRPRPSAVNSVRQIVSRLEENGGKYTSPLASPSSRQPRRTRKEALQADQYTNLPSRSSRSRAVGKTPGLTKAKSRNIYPGGYVGRSPTKKLRRKESPDS